MTKIITITIPTGHANYQGDIQHLVRQSLELIGTEGEEGAVWRLADALGILSEHYPQAIGKECPTGRGYQIIRSQD